MITLHLWVENQPGDSDETMNYIDGADWAMPDGIIIDRHAQTISGPADACWKAFRSLAKAVKAAGHGMECDDPPILTACPPEVIEKGYTSVGEALARDCSTTARTWRSFARAAKLER